MPIFPKYSGPPLLEQICGVENLTLAWRRVRSNIHVARRGRSAGPDLVTLRDFEADWSAQMARLADELRGGVYRPLPPRMVRIPKASGGERAIAILAIRDRVAQRAVQQLLQPLFEPLFLDCSYGCRLHVGVPDAVARVARYAEQGLTWAADTDIASYFDSIDQRILMGLLRQRIDEPPLLQLIAQWLQAGAMAEGETDALVDQPVGAAALLRKGGEALRSVFSAPPLPTAPPPPAMGDPYAAAAWEQPDSLGWGMPRPMGLQGGLLAALSLAQPAVEGARMLAPHLRRLGTQRLMVGGAIAAGALAAGELFLRAQAGAAEARGAPQGGALSPLLANIYLHPFDLALTSHGLRLVRFMDDLVVMCASQEEAARALELMRRQLVTLRLRLNEEKTRVTSYAEGLEFLGQSLAPARSGSRLAEGVTSFEEAERALRAASRQAGNRVRAGADQIRKRVERKKQ